MNADPLEQLPTHGHGTGPLCPSTGQSSAASSPASSPPPPIDPLTTRPSLLLKLRSEGPAREVAWDEFFRRYGPVIARYAERSGAQRHEVDDVVQDVMKNFYAVQPRFSYEPQRGRFRHFLRVCAHNATMSRLRKRRHEAPGAVPADELAAQAPAEAPESEKLWDELWEAQQLERAVEALKRRYDSNAARRRTFRAFEMNVLQGQDAAVVAERLQMSRDLVYAAKKRLVDALREELQAICEESE